MTKPETIAEALEHLAWNTSKSGSESAPKSSLCDGDIWAGIEQIMKERRIKATEELSQNIYLSDYRYWFDRDNLYRQRIEEQPFTEKLITAWVRRTMKAFDALPDNSEVCSSGLFIKACNARYVYNLCFGWWQIIVDNVFYGEYTNKRGHAMEVDWEIYDRFCKAVSRRKDIISDPSRIVGRCLGLPYNIGVIYRKKSTLFQNAKSISEKDAVTDSNGKILYYKKTIFPSDGNTLEILKILPGTPTIKNLAGEESKLIEVLSGKVRLESFSERQYSNSVEGDGNLYWEESFKSLIFEESGGICSTERAINPPIPAYYQITNVGETEAFVLISYYPRTAYK